MLLLSLLSPNTSDKTWIKTFEIGLVNAYLARNVRSTDTLNPVFKNLVSLRQDWKLHIDIVGPLFPVIPANESYPSPYRYLLTCIDRATRWMKAVPMSDVTPPLLQCRS